MRSIEIPQPDERGWLYRSLEIIPGLLTWTILSAPLWLALISPLAAAYFIIAYVLFWFFRAIGLNFRAIQGWANMRHHKQLDWQSLNNDLEVLNVATKGAPSWHARNLARVQRNMGRDRILPSQLYHAVIIACWDETRDILEPTIQAVIDSQYDIKKIILLIAYEQRGGPQTESLVKALIRQYGKNFYHSEAVMHPWPMVGEVIGKGGNINYAGRRLKQILKAKNIDPLRVQVTTLDADNRVDKKYFGALAYTYCSTEEPKNSSYQPIVMFTNNIWDAPAPMRVIATGNSFWMTVVSMRPHMLRNFSSHSQSMAALIDTDFWSSRTIVEDGHQYWRTFFRYDGNHEVYPIYVPIYQDAVLAATYRRTLKMQFVQLRRWAWGASDIAYVIYMGFFKSNRVPRLKLWARLIRLIEGHVSWSTAPLILAFSALIPLLLYRNSFVANQLPQITGRVITVAMVGVLVTLFFSFKSLPPKPERYKRHRTFFMIIQWIYLPLTSILYAAGAAIYSQTRLMLGWYFEWVITEKAVRK